MENDMLSTFGEILKAYRKQQHITQQELAARIGTHRNTIGIWERGDGLPKSKTIIMELAYQLHLDTHDTRCLLEASLTALSPYWLIPYQRNPFFTGREDVLQKLHNTLTEEHIIVLNGLGGIGKTQTAIEYAYRFANDYSAVFWIGAETSEHIISSLITIATLLNLVEKQEKEEERIVLAVNRWLTNHSDWLLILDQVEDPALIKDVIPFARRGSMLFTSRRQSLGLTAQNLSLEPMTPEEGMHFLRRKGTQYMATEVVAAREIVEVMGGLPLALEQASLYIDRNGCSLTDYRRLFQQHQSHLLQEHSSFTAHPHSVTETVLLSLRQITQANAVAAELLHVCAFLAPDAIPEDLFTQGASHLGPLLGPIVSCPYQFNQVLGDVLDYSLLSRQPQTHTFSMHRLVQAVLRESIAEPEQWIERIVEAIDAVFPVSEPYPRKNSERLLPHALACITQTTSWKQTSLPLASLLFKIAHYLYDRARYEEANLLYQRAVQIGEQISGPDDPEKIKAQADSTPFPKDAEYKSISSSAKSNIPGGIFF